MKTREIRMSIARDELAKMIDHAKLKAAETAESIRELCADAKKYDFGAVCVNSSYVELCVKELEGTGISVCSVVGFPLGMSATRVKAEEARFAVEKGAREVDMVINVGMLKEKRYDYVREDIRCVVDASGEAIVKVIIETCYLDDEEKIRACRLAKEAGAHFVKTSTGFGTGGATIEDVRLMRETVGPDIGVKASGGISDFDTAKAFIEAGANRIGTSSGVRIMEGFHEV